jgi:outer membrane protein assembly factor BamD
LDDRSFELAIKEFEAFLLQYPGNDLSDDAQFYLGKCRYGREEFLLAAFEFSKLIKNMPSSSFVVESQYELAMCYYELSPAYSLDQRYTRHAILEFQTFIDLFPADERKPEIEKKMRELYERLAEKEFNAAFIYEKMEYYNAALTYYDKVIDTYHDTKYAPLASVAKIKLLLQKNRKSEALTESSKFIERYPKDENLSEVQSIKAELEKQ